MSKQDTDTKQRGRPRLLSEVRIRHLYERVRNGETIPDVARSLKISPSTARRAYNRYRAKHGLPDVRPRYTSEERHREWYVAAMSGRTYESIAQEAGVLQASVHNAVKDFVARHGLPMPARGCDGETAYTLRLSGMLWREVAEACCHRTGTTTQSAARRYAWRNGLPWPIRPDTQQGEE